MQFRWTRKPSILELISVHQLVKITTKLHRHTVPSLKQVLHLNHLFLASLVVTSRLTCLKHPHCEYSMDEETGLEGILSPVHSRPSYNTIGQKKLLVNSTLKYVKFGETISAIILIQSFQQITLTC